MQLTAAPKDQFGNAFTATVTWASSNTAAATVSSTGLVTGVAQGPANITASSGGVSGAGIVTVVGAGGPGPFPSAADVTMPNNTFSPFVTDIARTGTVRFIFPADAHNVIFTAGTAGAPANIDVLSNTNQSRQFNTAGIFQYFCTLHDGMIAVIVVH